MNEDPENHSWTRVLWRMTEVEEMVEFVQLWDLIMQVMLTEGEDTIRWRWTANGEYSAKLAYNAQFHGSFCSFQAMELRRAQGKYKFFAWLLVQTMLLTAYKLMKRNWPCNEQCVLCDQFHETVAHLCLHCP